MDTFLPQNADVIYERSPTANMHEMKVAVKTFSKDFFKRFFHTCKLRPEGNPDVRAKETEKVFVRIGLES